MSLRAVTAALVSAATAAVASVPGTDKGLADTTRVHGLDEVVVTGTNQAMPRRLLPYTVSVVGQREIEATGKTQLLSALSGEVPGLFVTQRNILGFGVSNGGSGGIKIRGVGGSPTSGVLMMVDGQPQFAGLFSHPVADFYETEYVDHVEVMRGPGSVLYGSNAMGGVINVITRQAKHDGISTTLTSQFGSHSTWQNSLTSMARKGRLSAMLSAGYDQTDGLKRGFDFKQKSLYAKVGYDISRHWELAADYSLMNFIGNDPVYARLKAPKSTDVYHQNITRGETSLTLSNKYLGAAADGSGNGATNGVARVYYSYGNHYIDDPHHFHSLDDRFGVLAYQSVQPWRNADATVGFDFNSYTGRIPVSGGHSFGDGSQQAQMQTISRKSITEYSPYATLQQTLAKGRLTLSAGLRMANSDKFGTKWVPQAGFSLRPAEGWSVRGSVARGYRNPSFKEMYLYRMANPELDPEDMTNYEVSVGRHFSPLLGIDVTAFFAEGSNMIQTASVTAPDGSTSLRNVNTGSFRNKGVEVALQSRPLSVLSLRASYSYLHSSDKQLVAAPKNQYMLAVGWQAMKQLSVDAQLKGVGGLYVAEGVAHQNYALLGMRITYKPAKWIDVFANLDNITDAHYMINKGYDMPGFNAMGGIKLRF